MTKICIDLFSGAGGLSEGLASAGFHSLYASEINPVFATTYRNNHPYSIVDTGDIKEVNSDEVMKRLGIERGELDLMAGGPPCQGFSINAPVRSKKDQRNHLFREFLRFVDTFQPKTILIENVPGLVSFENGATLHAILSSLVNLGYGAEVRILGAPYYGVPQMRWRTIILGVRGMQLPADAYPEPLYRAPIRTNFRVKHEGKLVVKMPSESAVEGFTTVEDAISDLPKISCGEKYEEGGIYASKPKSEYQKRLRIGSAGVFNHESSGLSKVNLERLKFIKPGRNWTDIPFEMLPEGMKLARRSDHTKRYGRVDPKGLSSTILTKCDPHWGAFIHYNQDRPFSVREAARIQSFPDHFIFSGSLLEQYAQVGNAVPPMLAEAVGQTLMKIITREFK